ncbi:hypothetical protein [Tenacibaculum ovolyticum]|uniref:hypothetical protein n=1 Tax=Tenacibaculum ovolyticum TaxID=104270 RepID=UPI0007EC581D|nr:hypothetical protein [Tenacibaculum ovolyticum]
MKFKEFKDLELKTVESSVIKGGTSSTEYTTIGVMENEQELDSNGKKIGKPKLINFPSVSSQNLGEGLEM